MEPLATSCPLKLNCVLLTCAQAGGSARGSHGAGLLRGDSRRAPRRGGLLACARRRPCARPTAGSRSRSCPSQASALAPPTRPRAREPGDARNYRYARVRAPSILKPTLTISAVWPARLNRSAPVSASHSCGAKEADTRAWWTRTARLRRDQEREVGGAAAAPWPCGPWSRLRERCCLGRTRGTRSPPCALSTCDTARRSLRPTAWPSCQTSPSQPATRTAESPAGCYWVAAALRRAAGARPVSVRAVERDGVHHVLVPLQHVHLAARVRVPDLHAAVPATVTRERRGDAARRARHAPCRCGRSCR